MFEDVPFDFRHIKARPMITRRPVRSFPLEWVESSIQREGERAQKTGQPSANWVEGAVQNVRERRELAAKRAASRHIKKQTRTPEASPTSQPDS